MCIGIELLKSWWMMINSALNHRDATPFADLILFIHSFVAGVL